MSGLRNKKAEREQKRGHFRYAPPTLTKICLCRRSCFLLGIFWQEEPSLQKIFRASKPVWLMESGEMQASRQYLPGQGIGSAPKEIGQLQSV
jgi:hypothetical protein